jgi:hypothetical protein
MRAVDTDSAFAFSHGPLQGIDKNPSNVVHKDAREMNVERFGFFFREFLSNAVGVIENRRMIIVVIPFVNVTHVAYKTPCKWDALTHNPKGTWYICRRLVRWRWTMRTGC